jgi:hypothetical protein
MKASRSVAARRDKLSFDTCAEFVISDVIVERCRQFSLASQAEKISQFRMILRTSYGDNRIT